MIVRELYLEREDGCSRDEAAYKMRSDLEMKLRNATDDNEREMIRRCLRSLDE